MTDLGEKAKERNTVYSLNVFSLSLSLSFSTLLFNYQSYTEGTRGHLGDNLF